MEDLTLQHLRTPARPRHVLDCSGGCGRKVERDTMIRQGTCLWCKEERIAETLVPSSVSTVTPGEVEAEVAYVINDEALGQPFPVYVAKTGRTPWWADSLKVQKLIGAFQLRANITQACISAGISAQQYRDFCAMHPEFQYIKDRCREYFGLQAKNTVGKGLKKDHWLAWEYLKGEEPAEFGQKVAGIPIPDGGSVTTLTEQAFMDADGKVVIRRKTAELLEKEYGGNQA